MKPSRMAINRNGKNTVTIGIDMGSVRSMFADIKRDLTAAARPAAQAGAQVLYEAVLQNVASIGRKSGNLAGSIYQVYSERQSGPGKATYHVSWNTRKAPHGHLLEFGHIQRYAVNLADDGNWYTLVRPSKRGQPRPKRRASQAEKDAYYVPRAGGPQQIAAKPFIRPAQYKMGAALEAAKRVFFEVMGGKQ